MKIRMFHLKPGPFGPTRAEYAPTTVFVTTDSGAVHVNPTIIENDDECVVFIDTAGEEAMGTAVTLATMTPAEALYIARRSLERSLVMGGCSFEWSRGTRRNPPTWCVGFQKQRGHRTHLLPCSDMDTCLDIAEGRKTIRYWTNSRRCEIVAA